MPKPLSCAGTAGSLQNALRAKPLDIREQYEKQLKELQGSLWRGHAGVTRQKKKLASLLGEDDR
ncbi:hypothetical protein [Salmonella enterica]|uniref:hypothetical protein n=1 Tax=Salmonella enterica TaxID=28901 RepID=UPI001BCD5DFD|nr:hypothetical protein [Salmonella enterica]